MVSIAQTSRKYRGRKAATYDEVREKQARWAWENEHVARWLDNSGVESVLDVPMGTGRFLSVYADINVKRVMGIDVSEEMLALARRKVPRSMKQYCDLKLVVGDATRIEAEDRSFDLVVCVRFLDLIDEEAMHKVVRELCRVARDTIILTIRFSGDGMGYVPKVNTAEHDRKKFVSLIKRLGWRVDESHAFRDAGWEILNLERSR